MNSKVLVLVSLFACPFPWPKIPPESNAVAIARLQTRDRIVVMQAYVDGKSIEVNAWYRGDWVEEKKPRWDWWRDDYRIKVNVSP